MAKMIPSKPINIPQYSREDEMFSALEKLPDDYYIFHSLRIIKKSGNNIKESETDFVIFHPEKGIMCIEAKAGQVKCYSGTWYYASGDEMKKGGPYEQANNNKWKLRNYFHDNSLGDITKKCKFIHAVWFPSIQKIQLRDIEFGTSDTKELTLTAEALENPQKYIDEIFDYNITSQPHTTLTPYDVKKILNNVLCPTFNVLPLAETELAMKNNAFTRMLENQYVILNFLENQPSAVISGVAGSGKTLLAVEKARRHSQNNERVLFLCYNKKLREHLNKTFPNENVDYYTLHGYAMNLCGEYDDFFKLKSSIEEMYDNGTFPYKHVIIDEAQDFGQGEINDHEILELLEIIVLSENVSGTFYLFYDKFQLIQGNKLPDYIQNAGCKLTLNTNCRNTANIAETSIRPLQINQPKLIDSAIDGDSTEFYIESDTNTLIAQIDSTIKELLDKKYSDIVILTCATEKTSILKDKVSDEIFKAHSKDITFTTCRKFKGLEADAILLVDVTAKTFTQESDSLIFYVGSSRAKHKLAVFAQIDESDYTEISNSLNIKQAKNFPKKIASKMNAILRH